MAWTEERVEKLRELWDKGLSASQIAKELAEGVTRNAVIGKAHRLGLASRPSPVKADAAKKAAAPKKAADSGKTTLAAKRAAAKSESISIKPVVQKRTGSGKITILELSERICKWPIGHPGDADFQFCGKPSQSVHPYCSEHCHQAYQVQQPRRGNRRLNRGRVSATPVK